MPRTSSRFTNAALFLACLIGTAVAEEAKAPPALDTLEQAVVPGAQERERLEVRRQLVGIPDVVAVTHKGKTQVHITLADYLPGIRFRRESDARALADSALADMQLERDQLSTARRSGARDFIFELTPDVEEADGLPAEIPFGPHTSLINTDYVRLRNVRRETVTSLAAVLSPQTRHCLPELTLTDEGGNYPNRFVLLADKLKECELVLKSREGDLFFADGFPEKLRQSLRDLVTPIYNHFALTLGSEPGITFLVWRPGSPLNDFRFERNWDSGSLVLFNGPEWQKGLDAKQKETLWESFAREQIARRLGSQGALDDFTKAAVDYLLVLAKSERDHATNRRLTAELPGWIATCARSMNPQPRQEASAQGESDHGCGMVLQFVYDAVARAQSNGKDAVYDTWRKLLNVSFKRNQFGVNPKDFIASSADAWRIMQGLINGSMDWPKFIEEMAAFGVQLRIKPGQDVQDLEVRSLTHFEN